MPMQPTEPNQKLAIYPSNEKKKNVLQYEQYNTIYWQLPTRGFSVTIYNSRGNQVDIALITIYNNYYCFLQIKSNVGFWWEGKTGVPLRLG